MILLGMCHVLNNETIKSQYSEHRRGPALLWSALGLSLRRCPQSAGDTGEAKRVL